MLGKRKTGYEVRDLDVAGVVAALREFAQAGDCVDEVVLGVENGVVEAQGQLQFRRGVGNAGDTDLGEQDGRPVGQVCVEPGVAYECGDASGHLAGAQAEAGQQPVRQVELKGEPLCLIGDSGTGKSHLLIGLGTAAAMAGCRVRYALAAKLVNELVEAADEKQLSKTIARYGRVDLLCIDELGYLELDRRGAEMLFQVLTEREEKNSVAIASNESFGGWTKTFTDPRLCAAVVDRLTFNSTIIETGTESYRLAQTKAKQQAKK